MSSASGLKNKRGRNSLDGRMEFGVSVLSGGRTGYCFLLSNEIPLVLDPYLITAWVFRSRMKDSASVNP